MIRVNYREQVINFLVFVIIQIILNNKMVLFDQAFAFFYVGFLMMLPRSLSRPAQLVIGFAIGLLVDVFYNTPGMNAGASVLLVFLRDFWLSSTYGDADELAPISVYSLGFVQFFTFIFPLVLIHHLFLFIVENGGVHHTIILGTKILLSSLFTSLIILIFNYLTAIRRRE